MGEPQAHPEWPAYCPNISTFDFRTVLHSTSARNRLQHLTDIMERAGKTALEQPRNCSTDSRRSHIDRKTIRMLLAAKLIREAPAGAATNSVCFLVPEPHKLRNRVICWPIWANNQADIAEGYQWDHNTSIQTDILDVVNEIHQHEYAAVFDLRCSFFQIGISEQASYAFVFEHRGKRYTWTRLPMGYCSSAEVMQIVCQELASRASNMAQEILATEKHTPHLRYHVHVDNILFMGDEASITAAITAMDHIARERQISLSDFTATAQQSVVWCGLHLNFDTKTISIADKSILKLKNIEQYLETRITRSSPHLIPFHLYAGELPLLKIIAVATFWSRVMYRASQFTAGSLNNRYCALQLARAIARTATTTATKFEMNRGSLNNLLAWFRAIPHQVRIPSLAPPHFKVTTDASVTGGGCVIRDATDNIVIRVAWHWTRTYTSKDISRLEARAVAIALQLIPTGSSVHLVTDSTATIGALQKGYSPSKLMNEAMTPIMTAAQSGIHVCVQITHVPSELNEADFLTRIDRNMVSIGCVATNGDFYMAWDGLTKYGLLGKDDLYLTMVGHGQTQLPSEGPHSELRGESSYHGRKTGGVTL